MACSTSRPRRCSGSVKPRCRSTADASCRRWARAPSHSLCASPTSLALVASAALEIHARVPQRARVPRDAPPIAPCLSPAIGARADTRPALLFACARATVGDRAATVVPYAVDDAERCAKRDHGHGPGPGRLHVAIVERAAVSIRWRRIRADPGNRRHATARFPRPLALATDGGWHLDQLSVRRGDVHRRRRHRSELLRQRGTAAKHGDKFWGERRWPHVGRHLPGSVVAGWRTLEARGGLLANPAGFRFPHEARP